MIKFCKADCKSVLEVFEFRINTVSFADFELTSCQNEKKFFVKQNWFILTVTQLNYVLIKIFILKEFQHSSENIPQVNNIYA